MFSRNPERSPVPGTTPVPDRTPVAPQPPSPAPSPFPPGASGVPVERPERASTVVTGVRDVATTPSPTLARAVDAGTTIARTDRIEGTIRTTEALRIMGTVEGRIEAGILMVDEGARVKAEIVADEAIIAGEVNGVLTVSGRLEVRATGRVSGQIEAVRLMLHEGGAVDGELRMMRQGDGSPMPARPTAPAPRREAPAAPKAEAASREPSGRAATRQNAAGGPPALAPLPMDDDPVG